MLSSALGTALRIAVRTSFRTRLAASGCAAMYSSTDWMSRFISTRALVILPQTDVSPRHGGGSLIQLLASAYFAAATALSLFAYFLRNRSTRPAVSTNRCLPVKNGWQTEQIST